MKMRLGFVSNSSSSSFIIRKSVLNENQINQIRDFFKKYDNCYYNTTVSESLDFFEGDVEAHNGYGDDDATANDLLIELIDSFNISLPRKKYFHIVYEDYAQLEDL